MQKTDLLITRFKLPVRRLKVQISRNIHPVTTESSPSNCLYYVSKDLSTEQSRIRGCMSKLIFKFDLCYVCRAVTKTNMRIQ